MSNGDGDFYSLGSVMSNGDGDFYSLGSVKLVLTLNKPAWARMVIFNTVK